jgi:CO/xanthine dehydrogenase FAD-binding subunit
MSDLYASAAYRQHVIGKLLMKALHNAAERKSNER